MHLVGFNIEIYYYSRPCERQVYDVLYSLNSRRHVSAAIAAIFRVMVLLQQYKCTNVFICVAVTP